MEIKNFRSPWGAAQCIDDAGNGIRFISTASHGGYKVPAKINKIIPSAFRRAGGFYEEDCEWAIVDYFLSAYLTSPKIEEAKKALKSWYYAEWEQFTGETVDPAESCTKRDALFKIATADKWVVISASGDWKDGVPKGYVEGTATLGGNRDARSEERTYYIKDADYDTRGNDGYVIRESDLLVKSTK